MSDTAYPQSSEATVALVLGIVTLVAPFLAPFAWFYGHREVKAIDAGLRDPSNRASANTGRLIGMIVTIVGASVLVFVVLAIVLALIDTARG